MKLMSCYTSGKQDCWGGIYVFEKFLLPFHNDICFVGLQGCMYKKFSEKTGENKHFRKENLLKISFMP